MKPTTEKLAEYIEELKTADKEKRQEIRVEINKLLDNSRERVIQLMQTTNFS